MIKIMETAGVDIDFFDNDSAQSKEDLEAAIRFSIVHNSFRKMFSIWDLEEEKVVCFLGFNFVNRGIYEIWIARSKTLKEYRAELWSTVKEFCDEFIKDKLIHRYQAVVCTDDFKYIKFLNFLGMHCEGLMKNYINDNRDFYLLARGA